MVSGCRLITELFFTLAPGLAFLSCLQYIDLSCLCISISLDFPTSADNHLDDNACATLGQVLMGMPMLKQVDLHCTLSDRRRYFT